MGREPSDELVELVKGVSVPSLYMYEQLFAKKWGVQLDEDGEVRATIGHCVHGTGQTAEDGKPYDHEK